ncbi:MAG: proteasome subunit alpha [Actinomycetota bacterium]
MAMPFYVAPEQMMKDRADYARKGIARGKSVLVLEYVDGLLFLAENPSRSLHKISEIYDRMAFAAVGKYNEFENLRVAGVRLADIRGYSYGRQDVTARSLANAYSQTLGAIFTQDSKPFEVELLVAEVGAEAATSQIFHVLYDGSVADERGFVGIGGQSEELTRALRQVYHEGMTLEEALVAGASALNAVDGRALDPDVLEGAALDRRRPRRKFHRIEREEIRRLLGEAPLAAES